MAGRDCIDAQSGPQFEFYRWNPTRLQVPETRMSDRPLTPEELILRDHLAIDRTRLANERTLLAYLRTSLMLLVAGATAVKLVDINTSILITGWIFLVLGVITGAVGIWRFLAMRRAISRRDH
jgi:putative membrane protein